MHTTWYNGLSYTAILTICFGIIEFTLFNIVALRGRPSTIHAYLMFPTFTFLVFLEFIFFITVGAMLRIALYTGNLNLIKSFPWLLLFSYLLATLHIILTFWNGEEIAMSLALTDFGMFLKLDPAREARIVLNEKIVYYTSMIILLISLIAIPTYLMILSLSWTEKLETEIDKETDDESESDEEIHEEYDEDED